MFGKVIITLKAICSLLLKTLWGSISFSLQQTIKCNTVFACKVAYYFTQLCPDFHCAMILNLCSQKQDFVCIDLQYYSE